MTAFRCPYCRQSLGAEPVPRCPHCDKSIVIAGRLRKTTFRERQRLREKLARNAARQRRAVFTPELRGGRNPAVIGAVILGLVIIGSLVIGRAGRKTPAVAPVALEGRAARELYALHTALARFHTDTGRYPTTAEGLSALVRNPGIPGWGGHYVNVIKPDPWHTPYRYALTPEGPDLRSAGPDRQLFTSEDLLP